MKMIAVHEVHICKKPGSKGVRPETEKIPPKGKFEISDKQGEELLRAKAAVLDPDADADDEKAAKAADKAAKKAADDADKAAKKAAADADKAAKKAAEDKKSDEGDKKPEGGDDDGDDDDEKMI